jgi:hypothetical protein
MASPATLKPFRMVRTGERVIDVRVRQHSRGFP